MSLLIRCDFVFFSEGSISCFVLALGLNCFSLSIGLVPCFCIFFYDKLLKRCPFIAFCLTSRTGFVGCTIGAILFLKRLLSFKMLPVFLCCCNSMVDLFCLISGISLSSSSSSATMGVVRCVMVLDFLKVSILLMKLASFIFLYFPFSREMADFSFKL